MPCQSALQQCASLPGGRFRSGCHWLLPRLRLLGCWQSLSAACACAQVHQLLKDGVNVGLGVDGSASNDSGNLLHEARLACFLQRAAGDVSGGFIHVFLWSSS